MIYGSSKLGGRQVWESGTYHECGQVILVRLSFGLEIDEIKVSISVRFDGDNFQASHDSRLQQQCKLDNAFLHKDPRTAGLVP